MPLFLKFKATWTDDLSNMKLFLNIKPEFEYILNNCNEDSWEKKIYGSPKSYSEKSRAERFYEKQKQGF